MLPSYRHKSMSSRTCRMTLRRVLAAASSNGIRRVHLIAALGGVPWPDDRAAHGLPPIPNTVRSPRRGW